MPRIQVYLPDDLYREAKERALPTSELLQGAVRAEVRRQDLIAEGKKYLDDLIAEVGEPTPEGLARARATVRRMSDHEAKHRRKRAS